MSTKIYRGLRAFITLSVLLVVGAFFIAKAIETKEVVKEVEKVAIVATTWHFTGNDPSEILEPENWEEGTSPNTSCVTNNTRPLPCTFIVSDANVTDADDLMDYFESKYPADTENQVAENAESTRDPQP